MSTSSSTNFSRMRQLFNPIITPQENAFLISLPSIEEIIDIIKKLNPQKALERVD